MIPELTNQFIFGGAILALLCVIASILSRRFGAPILLVFLVLGMLAGEDGPGGIIFNNFGLAFFLANLSLAIIIFDGGLGTRKDTFRVSLAPALSLATVGVVLTAAITGAATYWILNLSWQEALLIGAIVGSTDAAAVFGLLRFAGLELKQRTGATLEIESGTNDPMAIFLTVTMVQIISVADGNVGIALIKELIQQMGLGLAIGFAGGFLLVSLIKRLNLPASLFPLFVFAAGLSIFGITNIWGGSGFLAIYIVGVLVGNTSLPYGNDIHRFHDGMAWLSQIGMFLMLGLLITPSHLPPIIVPAIAIALVLIFIARPIAVVFSLLPFHFPWREQVFISWCGLRGAVPIILALFPSLAGLEQTEMFFELVFFVVLISLVLQGWTIAPFAKLLGIQLPPWTREPEHITFSVSKDKEKELHIYDIVPGCNADGMSTHKLPLAEGAQLVGIIRRGYFIDTNKPQKLAAQDQVMLLASSGSTSHMGALFAPPSTEPRTRPIDFFGEFAINPDASLSDLATLYGFELPTNVPGETVGQFLIKKFHSKPVVGDRAVLGAVQFVVRETQGDRITVVGLKLRK